MRQPTVIAFEQLILLTGSSFLAVLPILVFLERGGLPEPKAKVHVELDEECRGCREGTVSEERERGARFSKLPPDNASENFVTVAQRVPVRIRWTDPPTDALLRAGLSADVTVYVSH